MGLESSGYDTVSTCVYEERSDQEMSGTPTAGMPAVRVCVRVRPLLEWEKAEGHEVSALECISGPEGSVTLTPSQKSDRKAPCDCSGAYAKPLSGQPKSFCFDHVFGPDCSQEDVWVDADLEGLVEKVLSGFHATVFTYGQTGSGKTHTIEGFMHDRQYSTSAPQVGARRPTLFLRQTPSEHLGVVPRAVHALFERVKQEQAMASNLEETFSVKVSFLQIYKEKVYDLFNPDPLLSQGQKDAQYGDAPGLKLRWDAGKGQFHAENLFEFECCSADEALSHYAQGVLNKQVASTAMNFLSSRSHTVFVLTLVRQTKLGWSGNAGRRDLHGPISEVVSKLSLVDLAGSERASAGANIESGLARFREAVNINTSLFVLRKVITALSRRSEGSGDVQHVPYRESKLTSLLQHSIGGNGFMLMLACLSPSDRHYEENLSTLQYATQAACIKNQPTVNLDPKDQLIQQLQSDLAAAHAYILRSSGLSELPTELQQASSAAVVGVGCSKCHSPGVLTTDSEPGSRKEAMAVQDTVEPVPGLARARSWQAHQWSSGSTHQPAPRNSKNYSGEFCDTMQTHNQSPLVPPTQWYRPEIIAPRFVPRIKREMVTARSHVEPSSPMHFPSAVIRAVSASSATTLPSCAWSEQSVTNVSSGSSDQASFDPEEATQRVPLKSHETEQPIFCVEQASQDELESELDVAVSHLEDLKAKLQACREESFVDPLMPGKLHRASHDPADSKSSSCLQSSNDQEVTHSKFKNYGWLVSPFPGPHLASNTRLDLYSTS